MSAFNFKTLDPNQAMRYVTKTLWPDSRLIEATDTTIIIMVDVAKTGRRWDFDGTEKWVHSKVPYEA